jgi:hypothetical protein
MNNGIDNQPKVAEHDMNIAGHDHYILDDQYQPVAATSLMAWADWMEVPEHVSVKQDYIGKYFISTIFLGIDHDHIRVAMGIPHAPLIFETMAFLLIKHSEKDERESLEQERCCTWDEAIKQHAEMVEKYRSLPLSPGVEST